MALPKRVHSSPNEGNILLAISAFNSGHFPTISATAKAYSVSKTTLFRRISSAPSREDYRPINMRLSKTEERVLLKDILQLDSQGLSPSLKIIKDKASAICKARGAQAVGINWALLL